MAPTDDVPALITETDRLEALCDELSGEEFYAIDTEFHTERTYWPALALIQLAWQDRVALVDPLAVDPAPLRRLFEGPGTAVAHAAGQDLDILRTACGAAPGRVFDTQVAAGFLGMSSPSLARLVDLVLGISLAKADQLSDWLHRPLPATQLAYAAGDVEYLLALRSTMVDRLEQRGRLAWALEECTLVLPGQRRSVVPEEAWWKVGDVRRLTGRARGVAQEVTAWRERRAAAVDRPRRSVLSDLAILTIAQRPPHNRQELEKLRGVDARSLAKGAAGEILEAVDRGRALAQDELRLPPDAAESKASPVAVAVCAGLVRQIADELDFDQGLLATRSDIALLVVGEPSRLDQGWRGDIAGDPIRWLLAGEVAAAFDADGQLVLEARSHVPAGSDPAT
ncbi:MAG TPA: HRDC domain-containing protein [Acidimicrobiales bacterium]